MLSGGEFGAEASILTVVDLRGARVWFTRRAIAAGRIVPPYWRRRAARRQRADSCASSRNAGAARRRERPGQHWRDEIWNALTHGFGFLLSLVASAVLLTLVASGDSDGWQLAGALVFCIALVLVYTSSTLYHSIPHVATKRRMKVFDHCAIFVLIAGTYTPFTLVALREVGGWWLFGVAWTLAAIGIVLKLFLTGRFKGISTIVYIAMGWMAVLAIKPMLARCRCRRCSGCWPAAWPTRSARCST